jgi:hypothetical protein
MRVLVIHPEDELQGEAWSSTRWDRVIDLGRSGVEVYARSATEFGCPVTSVREFRRDFREMRRVRTLLSLGMGRLNDAYGLDWWELTAILVHQYLETAFLMGELVNSFGSRDEVHVSRPGLHADVLRLALGSRLHAFGAPADRRQGAWRRHIGTLRKFPASQLLEIFWDKFDAGYQIRGGFSRKRNPSPRPVVLMPSSYINVSRTGVGYAKSLPDARFLLVVTRRSGWMENLPANVTATWLRQYASVQVPSRKLEYNDLLKRWNGLRRELKETPEIRALDELGYFNGFPNWFGRGLEIRDAWRNVLDSEPVQAVICADDTNPHTHIPLILAANKGLPTIACHHGALDGRHMFKRNHADVLLAKGKMEQDYLVRVCGTSPEKVEIGAPATPLSRKPKPVAGDKPLIIFFSEAYEVAGGRGRDFYEDVLPALADLAIAQGKELIVKLHPSESPAERGRFLDQVLTGEQRRVARVVTGALDPEILNKTWFGVTVMSTVVVECALQGIPCFLCVWLEAWPYGYDDQFDRFGLGIRLTAPSEIREIPAMLLKYTGSGVPQANYWNPIDKNRLRSLLGPGQDCAESATTENSRMAESR